MMGDDWDQDVDGHREIKTTSSLRKLPSTVPALSVPVASVPVTTLPVSKYCAYDCCAHEYCDCTILQA